MTFRDDREALIARIDALERELAEGKAQHAKAAEEATREIEELKAKLRVSKKPKKRFEPRNWPKGWTRWAMVVPVLVVVCLMLYLTWTERRPATPTVEPPRVASRPPAPALPVPVKKEPPKQPPVEASGPLAWADAGLQRGAAPVSEIAGLVLAFHRAGDRDGALRWTRRSEPAANSGKPAARAGDLALLSCVAGELGDEPKRAELLRSATAAVADGMVSYADASAAYQQAALACLNLELGAYTAPLLAAAYAAASKVDHIDSLTALALLYTRAGDKAGLKQLTDRLLRKYGMADYRGRRARGALAIHAATLGEQKRARQLIGPLLRRSNDAVEVSLLLHALAAVGEAVEVRKRLPAALETVRSERLDELARQHLGTACALIGELERGRTLAVDWPTALADARRWDDLLPLRRPGLNPWLELAIHLREEGRFDLSLEVTGFGDRHQSTERIAASYKTIHARRRAASKAAEKAP